MATSSKVRFRLADLQAKALEAVDAAIEAKEQEVAALMDEDRLDRIFGQWRKGAEQAVRDLHGSLETVADHTLAAFRLPPMPTFDTHAHTRAVKDLAALRATRATIRAKSASLVAGEDGTIALTKNQLSEFFAL